MHPLIIYLSKMLLCSAVLLGYYWLALRNERFHQWNRFYLLGAMVLSVVLPLISIPLFAPEEPTIMVTMLAELPWNQVKPKRNLLSGEDFAGIVMLLVSIILLVQLLMSVHKVWRLYIKHPRQRIGEVDLVVTTEPSAPFSFFQWLFWRNDIDPDSENGKRMLQHELAHIHQKHSIDKLIAEVLLVVFWMNPLFWIMRRELFAIHEFLADQKAIEGPDGAAFAAMILQAAGTGNHPHLSSPFFTSQLKRRLKMITTSQEPRFSYLRRISGLVVMVCMAVVLVFTIQEAVAQKAPPPPPAPPTPKALPDSIKRAKLWDKNDTCMMTYTMKDGRVITMTLNDAEKRGYPPPPPPPPPPTKPEVAPVKPVGANGATSMISITSEDEPLYVYAGLVITKQQADQIDPNQIESIDVLKGQTAVERYGEKGKNGVVIISPKAANYSNTKIVQGYPSNTIKPGKVSKSGEPVTVVGYAAAESAYPVQKSYDPQPVTVVGYPATQSPAQKVTLSADKIDFESATGANPLVFLDGRPSSMQEIQALGTDRIASVNVWKGEKVKEKFGSDAADGAIEVFTKNYDRYDKVFTKAENMPSFPGGQEGWKLHLQKNLRYPDAAIKNFTQGDAIVQFVVAKDGTLGDFKILQNPGDGLGEEAVRVIKEGPNWIPAKQNNIVINARVTQKVNFRLE